LLQKEWVFLLAEIEKKGWKMMKAVAFNGSSRKDGNTAILLNLVLDELKIEGIETELIQLAGETLSGCFACYKVCRK
jgi:multimeric flavodoxin WrbA